MSKSLNSSVPSAKKSRPKLPCPFCKEELAADVSGVWPFCSKRCKLMDIGKWADGSYAIPDSRASGVSSEEAESSGLSTQADSSFSEPSIFDDSQDEEK